ncbi:MAG: hypothetical protein ABIN80_20905 [Dyadobacter sp.]|uniref:hypothetical protein n=1 Tax=Dyadobacter sp. TaxID=1914288 RepID=UPI0032637A4D
MNTLPNSKTQSAIGAFDFSNGSEHALKQQFEIIRAFFLTDHASEVITSLNAMVEYFLFSENLANVTPAMREDIVSQLLVVTFIAKLEKNYNDMKGM